jgi:hypothetical protein
MAKARTFVDHTISPYKLAGVLSEALQEEGIDRVVPPQYLYGLTRGEDARLKTNLTETGKQSVSAQDANEFIEAFIVATKERMAKKAAKEAEEAAEAKTK